MDLNTDHNTVDINNKTTNINNNITPSKQAESAATVETPVTNKTPILDHQDHIDEFDIIFKMSEFYIFRSI